jgi:hypothetical protein
LDLSLPMAHPVEKRTTFLLRDTSGVLATHNSICVGNTKHSGTPFPLCANGDTKFSETEEFGNPNSNFMMNTFNESRMPTQSSVISGSNLPKSYTNVFSFEDDDEVTSYGGNFPQVERYKVYANPEDISDDDDTQPKEFKSNVEQLLEPVTFAKSVESQQNTSSVQSQQNTSSMNVFSWGSTGPSGPTTNSLPKLFETKPAHKSGFRKNLRKRMQEVQEKKKMELVEDTERRERLFATAQKVYELGASGEIDNERNFRYKEMIPWCSFMFKDFVSDESFNMLYDMFHFGGDDHNIAFNMCKGYEFLEHVRNVIFKKEQLSFNEVIIQSYAPKLSVDELVELNEESNGNEDIMFSEPQLVTPEQEQLPLEIMGTNTDSLSINITSRGFLALRDFFKNLFKQTNGNCNFVVSGGSNEYNGKNVNIIFSNVPKGKREAQIFGTADESWNIYECVKAEKDEIVQIQCMESDNSKYYIGNTLYKLLHVLIVNKISRERALVELFDFVKTYMSWTFFALLAEDDMDDLLDSLPSIINSSHKIQVCTGCANALCNHEYATNADNISNARLPIVSYCTGKPITPSFHKSDGRSGCILVMNNALIVLAKSCGMSFVVETVENSVFLNTFPYEVDGSITPLIDENRKEKQFVPIDISANTITFSGVTYRCRKLCELLSAISDRDSNAIKIKRFFTYYQNMGLANKRLCDSIDVEKLVADCGDVFNRHFINKIMFKTGYSRFVHDGRLDEAFMSMRVHFDIPPTVEIVKQVIHILHNFTISNFGWRKNKQVSASMDVLLKYVFDTDITRDEAFSRICVHFSLWEVLHTPQFHAMKRGFEKIHTTGKATKSRAIQNFVQAFDSVHQLKTDAERLKEERMYETITATYDKLGDLCESYRVTDVANNWDDDVAHINDLRVKAVKRRFAIEMTDEMKQLDITDIVTFRKLIGLVQNGNRCEFGGVIEEMLKERSTLMFTDEDVNDMTAKVFQVRVEVDIGAFYTGSEEKYLENNRTIGHCIAKKASMKYGQHREAGDINVILGEEVEHAVTTDGQTVRCVWRTMEDDYIALRKLFENLKHSCLDSYFSEGLFSDPEYRLCQMYPSKLSGHNKLCRIIQELRNAEMAEHTSKFFTCDSIVLLIAKYPDVFREYMDKFMHEMIFTDHVKIKATIDKKRAKRDKEMQKIADERKYKVRMHTIRTNIDSLRDRKREDNEEIKEMLERQSNVQTIKQIIVEALNFRSLHGKTPDYTDNECCHALFRIAEGVLVVWSGHHESELERMKHEEAQIVAKANEQIEKVLRIGKLLNSKMDSEEQKCKSPETKKFVEEVRRRQEYKRMLDDYRRELKDSYDNVASRYGISQVF